LICQKDAEGIIKFKDLREIEYCPTVNNSVSNHDLVSPYKIFPYYMTLKGLLDMKKEGWNNEAIDEIFDKHKKFASQGPSKVPNIRIVEAYLDLTSGMFDGKRGDNETYDTYLVRASIDGNYYGNTKTLTSNERPLNCERILYWKKVKSDSLKLKKVDFNPFIGRNFGEGFIEATFDGQERVNEIQNNLANKLRISSKTLLQSRDDIIEENIFSDYDDGDIIKTENSDLKQVDISVHDMSNWLSTNQDWIGNMRLNTSGQEVMFGETMPSGTAYRLGSLMQQQGSKMFEFIRERLGVFISEMVHEWVIPDLLEEIKKDDSLFIKDVDTWNQIMETYVNSEISNAVIKYAIKNGKMPSDEEIESEKTKLLRNIQVVLRECYLN